MSLSHYAERRVLALLIADPQRLRETDLAADDFEDEFHSVLFTCIAANGTGDILELCLPDELSMYAVGLDENWAPENMGVFSAIVGAAAQQRAFVSSVSRLRGDPAKRFSL